MIIFWIFATIFGASAFAYGLLLTQWNVIGALAFAVISILVLRGFLSWIRRVLVLRERLPEEATADKRTLETNRYIFWRRLVMWGIPIAGVVFLFVRFPDLLQFLGIVALAAIYLPINFVVLFGPFLLFSRLGRQTLRPGDANYGVKIADVRGQKAAVDEMNKILKLMEAGRTYAKAGGKRERGVLMVGPPGTGKTMLAKAIATNQQMPIIISSGAAFNGMFIGMDMVAVWTMVRAAKKLARRWGGCTIFIDEFDALGQNRGGMGGGGMGGMMGMFGGFRLGLNMLLVLMDGVDNPGWMKQLLRRSINTTLDGLFVPQKIGSASIRVPALSPPRYDLFFIGATNRPSVLDPAVTRPGRFGRQIQFEMPTRENRKDIADLYFGKKLHDPALDTAEKREEFARVTEGFSPADIEQALSLALMYAFEDGRSSFDWNDVREALINVTWGLAKPNKPSEWDDVATARHEMGHAVAAYFYEPERAPVTLSIRHRADFLGVHVSVPRTEQFGHFRSHHAGRLRTILAALATERVFYGENGSGVTGDLIQAASEACHMIGVYGMGPDQLDPDASRRAADLGETLISRAEVTQGMQEQGTIVGTVLSNPLARRNVAQVIGSAYIDVWRLIFVNRDGIDKGAQMLVEGRELVGAEIENMLDSIGLRMFCDNDPYPEEAIVVPGPRREEEPAPDRPREVPRSA